MQAREHAHSLHNDQAVGSVFQSLLPLDLRSNELNVPAGSFNTQEQKETGCEQVCQQKTHK
jgi:hypothetical protein